MEEEKGGRGELHVYRKHHHLNSLPQRGYMSIYMMTLLILIFKFH